MHTFLLFCAYNNVISTNSVFVFGENENVGEFSVFLKLKAVCTNSAKASYNANIDKVNSSNGFIGAIKCFLF